MLAFELIQQGKSVLVLNENNAFTSSKVAAGLYNPIVFKRIVKSWMVDEVLPAANFLYAMMEDVLGKKFHHKREIVKLFSSADEKEFWMTRAESPELSAYLANQSDEDFLKDKIENVFSCSFVKQAGNVDFPLMLALM